MRGGGTCVGRTEFLRRKHHLASNQTALPPAQNRQPLSTLLFYSCTLPLPPPQPHAGIIITHTQLNPLKTMDPAIKEGKRQDSSAIMTPRRKDEDGDEGGKKRLDLGNQNHNRAEIYKKRPKPCNKKEIW